MTVVTLWSHLKPFMDARQAERGVNYKRFFKWFYEEALKYQRENCPTEAVKVVLLPLGRRQDSGTAAA
jgi:hypothetical protein